MLKDIKLLKYEQIIYHSKQYNALTNPSDKSIKNNENKWYHNLTVCKL